MVKVAVIDDGVGNEVCCYKHYSVKNGYIVEYTPRFNYLSHGTICAYILSKTKREIEIIDIQVFHGNKADYNDIACALKKCIELDIDVVNMSFGTTNYIHYSYIKGAIQELLDRDIFIVSAFSNSYMVSFPAACKNIFGVRSGTGNNMKNGEFGFNLCSGLELENCLVAHQNSINYNSNKLNTNGNSYAASVITGVIVKLLMRNPGLNFQGMLFELVKEAELEECKCKNIKRICDTLDNQIMTPVVGVCCPHKNIVKQLKENLFKDKYFPIVLTEQINEETDIPISIYCLEGEPLTKNMICTLECVYKADIIIIFLNKYRFMQENIWDIIDCILSAKDMQIEIKFKNSSILKDINNFYEYLINIMC